MYKKIANYKAKRLKTWRTVASLVTRLQNLLFTVVISITLAKIFF